MHYEEHVTGLRLVGQREERAGNSLRLSVAIGHRGVAALGAGKRAPEEVENLI